ncbi:MAG TPA: hypothetical protein VGF08_04840, partial [Terriglobales bacterium]
MAARKVILYFDDHADALRFALAAGSVMSGEALTRMGRELVEETQRANRVRLGDGAHRASAGGDESALAA